MPFGELHDAEFLAAVDRGPCPGFPGGLLASIRKCGNFVSTEMIATAENWSCDVASAACAPIGFGVLDTNGWLHRLKSFAAE